MLKKIISLSLFAILSFFLILPVHAITWCHDYTRFVITGKDANRTSPDSLRFYLSKNGFGRVQILLPTTVNSERLLKPGDVIIIGDAHSGVVNGQGSIDHFLQKAGATGKVYQPDEVVTLENFKRNWTIQNFREFYRINKNEYTGAEWKIYPYQSTPIELWRKGAHAVADWVVFATDVGWLRVGTRAEYEAKWQKSDEVFGGTSQEVLKKELLAIGFASREEALTAVCDHLRHVVLVHSPATEPPHYLKAVFQDQEYNLRLSRGNDPETAIFKGQEYDFADEVAILRNHHITPRDVFGGKQWLVHLTGHGSTEGPKPEDNWECIGTQPDPDEGGNWSVTLADGTGGTVTHAVQENAGPFLDNFTLAQLIKKYGVAQVDLWPPQTSMLGRDVQPRVVASEIPEDAKDYGDAVLPMQPLLPDPQLQDWLIYTVEGQWLCIGTRYEFDQPLLKREVIWAGTSDEPAVKVLLAPPEGSRQRFYSRRQALRALVAELTEITISYQPMNQPTEPITAVYRGKQYYLRLERGGDPDATLDYHSLNYDAGGIVRALRQVDKNITPRKKFREQWLVHATGHGTYSGPVKDDFWLMITAKPNEERKSFELPDGMGGTFGYSYDKIAGPFTDNYQLVPALRELNQEDLRVKSVGLFAENRGVSMDDIPADITPIDHGSQSRAINMQLQKLLPTAANRGEELGVTIFGKNIEPGCRFALSDGITIKNAVYFGRAADSDFDQWVATIEIDATAQTGIQTLTASNPDWGLGTLPKAFEVIGPKERERIFWELIRQSLMEMPRNRRANLLMAGTGSWMNQDAEIRGRANDIDCTVAYLEDDESASAAVIFKIAFYQKKQDYEKQCGLARPLDITLYVDIIDEGEPEFYRGATGNLFFYEHSKKNNPQSAFNLSLDGDRLKGNLPPERLAIEEFWQLRGKTVPQKIANVDLFVQDNRNFLGEKMTKLDDPLKQAVSIGKYVDRSEGWLKATIKLQWQNDLPIAHPDCQALIDQVQCLRGEYRTFDQIELLPSSTIKNWVMQCLGAKSEKELPEKVRDFYARAEHYFPLTEEQVRKAEKEHDGK